MGTLSLSFLLSPPCTQHSPCGLDFILLALLQHLTPFCLKGHFLAPHLCNFPSHVCCCCLFLRICSCIHPQLSLSRTEGVILPGKIHTVILSCLRTEVNAYSTYITIQNHTNPLDIKVIRVTARVCDNSVQSQFFSRFCRMHALPES